MFALQEKIDAAFTFAFTFMSSCKHMSDTHSKLVSLTDNTLIKVHALQLRVAGVDVNGKRVLGSRNRWTHGTLILNTQVNVTLPHMTPHVPPVLDKLLARLAKKATSSLHHVKVGERFHCKKRLTHPSLSKTAVHSSLSRLEHTALDANGSD
jgi:hypothetical protein